VNVMVAPHHGAPALGGAAPLSPAPSGAALPPPPPAMPPGMPPGMPPPGLGARPPMLPPGMPPPGMPMRARGGAVKDGPAYQEGKSHRPVDHAPGKQDTPDIGRGKVITYAKGGRVGERRLVKFWTGGKVERAKGGRVKSFGLGTHHLVKPAYQAHASGGIDPPKGPRHGGGSEAPHHVKKGNPLFSRNGPMGPNYHAGGGGGIARMKKAKAAGKFPNKVP
jgi:hypothetical protein